MDTSEETKDGIIYSTHVERPLEIDYDVGNLMGTDPNEIQMNSFKSNPSSYLKQLTRDNTQLLFNEIWTLPFERVDDVIVAKIPPGKSVLPREKPVPKDQGLTKWEQYAKDKGITKRKKTKLVWDEIVNAWVPRFGYRRAVAEHQKDWLLEVPQTADPYEDQFEKKSEMKSERVAKNELQRLRNIARSRKVQLPTTGIVPVNQPSKKELHQAMHVAKSATASLGKFQEKLPKEKPLRKTGKKRQFDPVNQNVDIEKTKNMDILQKIMNKKPKIDLEKAVNKEVSRSQREEANEVGKSEGGRKHTGKMKTQKNTKQKRGSAKKGSYKKGRSSARSKPKRKKH